MTKTTTARHAPREGSLERWLCLALGAVTVAAASCSVVNAYETVPEGAAGGGAGGHGGTTGHAGHAGHGGSGTTTSSGGGGGSGCPDYGSPCYSCAKTQCPELYCGCVTQTDCFVLSMCVGSCAIGNSQCLQECYAASPEQISRGALLSHCMGTACAAGCPGSEPLPACYLCLFTGCPLPMNACLADAECAAFLACVESCIGSACMNDCISAHPTATFLANAVRDCGQSGSSSCLVDCPWLGPAVADAG